MCSIKSKNNYTNHILNFHEFSHIIFTYTIEEGVTVVKSTVNHCIHWRHLVDTLV